jgi:hypothetical protein
VRTLSSITRAPQVMTMSPSLTCSAWMNRSSQRTTTTSRRELISKSSKTPSSMELPFSLSLSLSSARAGRTAALEGEDDQAERQADELRFHGSLQCGRSQDSPAAAVASNRCVNPRPAERLQAAWARVQQRA